MLFPPEAKAIILLQNAIKMKDKNKTPPFEKNKKNNITNYKTKD